MSCAQVLAGAVWLMASGWAGAVLPALLSTKEFPEKLPMGGQGRREVLKVLELSLGNLPTGTFSFP